MSRSRRIPIIKQKPRNYKRTAAYWSPIRSRINQIVRGYLKRYDNGILDLWYGEDCNELEIKIVEENSIMLGTDIPNPKTIINDWRYCDYVWDYRSPESWNSKYIQSAVENKIKYSRK
jgi:hypothetical protein